MTLLSQAFSPAPTNRLWAVASDIMRWPDHLETFSEMTQMGGTREGQVGQRFKVRQPGLPVAVYEITEWTEGSSFTWAARSPGVTTVASHTVTTSEQGSKLSLEVRWRGPLAPLMRLLMGGRTQRMIDLEAKTLARVAETDG